MFDQFLITINQWIGGSLGLALLGSFLWGMVSILFSPCHLASIPLMVGYVAGQNTRPQSPVYLAGLFTAGLLLSIAIIGMVTSLLGRMLGDISPLWGLPVGLIIIWLGLDTMGLTVCRVPSLSVGQFKMKGSRGAFFLGLMYGVLSGACTFGFIAPILALISLQGQMLNGLALIMMFALGHCLPIVLAGSSVELTKKILQAKGFSQASSWGRQGAGLLISFVGLYIVMNSFFG